MTKSKKSKPLKEGGSAADDHHDDKSTFEQDPITQFLTALFGSESTGQLLLWTKHDKRSYWVPANRLKDVPEFAKKLAANVDVYFGVGLRKETLGPNARGRKKDVTAIPGAWVDIDLAGPGHAGTNYPRSEKAVEEFLASLPLPPTLIVHSGGGFHVYWLFERPWIFETDDERTRAAALVKGWQDTIRALAGRRGWKIDATHDLARVLRLPGTVNHKGVPKPVSLYRVNLEKRLSPDAFAPYLTPKQRTTGKNRSSTSNSDVVIARRALAQLDPRRADAYDDWVAVGMALHTVDDSLLDDWDQWSRSSAKYEPEACTTKWSGFTRSEDGLGLGSLSSWAQQDTPWPPLIPFEERSLPSFPVDALPDWSGRHAVAVAEFMQTPVDLPGSLSLAVLAVAAARMYEVEIRPGYQEPLNIYVLVVQGSGTRKSPVFVRMVRPIQDHERLRQDEERPGISVLAQQKRILEYRLASLEKKSGTATSAAERDKFGREAEEVRNDLDLIVVPALPRLMADDTTPEKLADLLALHGGRIAILSAEGHLFSQIAGLYSRGIPNLNVYLKGHAGDELITDRLARKGERVRRPALTIGLTVQPGTLTKLGERPDFRETGLLARFLYSMPDDRLGERKPEGDPIPEHVETSYVENLTRMLKLRSEEFDGPVNPPVLTLSPEAYQLHLALAAEIEPDLAPSGAFHPIQDWVGKLSGGVSRLAGLIHLAENLETRDPEQIPISEDIMHRAIELGRYFLAHAQAAFGVIHGDPARAKAMMVLRWLEKRWREPTFKQGDVYGNNRGVFERTVEVLPALALLADHGFVRMLPGPSRQPGMSGRPETPVFEIRPSFESDSA